MRMAVKTYHPITSSLAITSLCPCYLVVSEMSRLYISLDVYLSALW